MLTEGQKRYRKYKDAYAGYREKNREYANEYATKDRDIKRFGGNTVAVLERDEYSCQECGMTNEQHLKKWNRRITIDHVDGNGRYSETKNHDVDNLVTLCLTCHGTKDVKRRKFRPVN